VEISPEASADIRASDLFVIKPFEQAQEEKLREQQARREREEQQRQQQKEALEAGLPSPPAALADTDLGAGASAMAAVAASTPTVTRQKYTPGDGDQWWMEEASLMEEMKRENEVVGTVSKRYSSVSVCAFHWFGYFKPFLAPVMAHCSVDTDRRALLSPRMHARTHALHETCNAGGRAIIGA
jgi:hypothetical protein